MRRIDRFFIHPLLRQVLEYVLAIAAALVCSYLILRF